MSVLLGLEEGARRQICGFCVDFFAISAFFPFNFFSPLLVGGRAGSEEPLLGRAVGRRAGEAGRSPFSRPCRRTKSRPGPGGASAWKRAAPGAVGEGRRGRSAAPCGRAASASAGGRPRAAPPPQPFCSAAAAMLAARAPPAGPGWRCGLYGDGCAASCCAASPDLR